MEQTKQYEYVDLGLPSGLKWAKCNVGAEKETDYGDYFMWGSTNPNTADECAWEHAPFNGGNTSYNADAINSAKDTVCPNGILTKEYDAASQIMGGDWRMPTKDEIQELIDNTDSEWVTINGINGRRFTSRIDTSKYIFIPASGDRPCSWFGGQGRICLVWSSSLDIASPNKAWDLYFSSVYVHSDNYYRRGGFAVRGVMN